MEMLMKPVNNETIVRQLNWRYATKKFDPARKIQPPDWKTLEQALVLSPSSYGLQPWRFFVITNPDVRSNLRAAAYNQPQVTDASHLVVLAARRRFEMTDIDRHVRRVADVRDVPAESLEGMKNAMASILSRTPEQRAAWTARQAYIALGNFLATAAMLGIDACPMEGFNPQQFDEILGLEKQGYTAVVMVTAGYRAADDAYAKLPKVRHPVEDVVTHIA
jgi:nitroreductase